MNKNTAKKRTSRSPGGKSDGKSKHLVDQLQSKSTVKYTIERSMADINQLQKVKEVLKTEFYYKSFKTDSEVYRNLPKLYMDAVKKCGDLQLVIDELTAKLDTFEDLRSSICRISDFIKETDND